MSRLDCIEISDPEVERRCIEKWGAGHWADLPEDKKRDERAYASVTPAGQTEAS
jgi:hypothetical protein